MGTQATMSDAVRTVQPRQGDALAENEACWRSAVSGMHDGVILFGEQGAIVALNPAAERMFGLRAAEAAGRGVGELLSDPREESEAGALKAYRLAEGRVTEWVGRRPDGGTFIAEVSLAELALASGRYFAANVRDVSARKQLDRLKSDFVSVVSHELRTPITSLVGALKLATASPELARSAELARLVAIAMRNAERLVSLLGDIIDVEQIESGQLKIRRVPLDLREAAETAVNAYAGLTSEAVHVRTELAGGALPVEGDPERLVQVVLNLLSNAVKYSPAGGEVVVRLAAREGVARLSVHDDGPGIPPAFRARIFGKFQRADASDSRKKGGTGLGLAIARGIIDEHGGRIGFDTGAGAGTTFWFELPLRGGGHA